MMNFVPKKLDLEKKMHKRTVKTAHGNNIFNDKQ